MAYSNTILFDEDAFDTSTGVIRLVAAEALTAADETTVNSGDSGTDDVIDNHTARIGEIEAALIAVGLLAAPD